MNHLFSFNESNSDFFNLVDDVFEYLYDDYNLVCKKSDRSVNYIINFGGLDQLANLSMNIKNCIDRINSEMMISYSLNVSCDIPLHRRDEGLRQGVTTWGYNISNYGHINLKIVDYNYASKSFDDKWRDWEENRKRK